MEDIWRDEILWARALRMVQLWDFFWCSYWVAMMRDSGLRLLRLRVKGQGYAQASYPAIGAARKSMFEALTEVHLRRLDTEDMLHRWGKEFHLSAQQVALHSAGLC